MALAILLLAGAVAIGIYQGRTGVRTITAVFTGGAVLGVSNLLVNWPWFGAEPHTWMRTYLTGLAFTGWVSFVAHVVPFWLAWYLSKRLKSARLSHAA